jgi:hypothetical protein
VKFVALVTLAVVVVTAVTACGSSHRRVVQGSSVSIHIYSSPARTNPARPRHNSVMQVEAAFVRRGIHLHKATQVLPDGYVTLRHGARPRAIAVFVYTAKGSPGMYYDVHSPGERLARHRNVVVIYDRGLAAAVRAALAELP